MKNYQRVIARDFFNEAKLLKCMGQLALKIHDRQLPEGCELLIYEKGDPFDIQLLDESSLWIYNYPITFNGILRRFKTTYNSKSAYPFFCEINDSDIQVFDDSGEFTEEFKQLF